MFIVLFALRHCVLNFQVPPKGRNNNKNKVIVHACIETGVVVVLFGLLSVPGFLLGVL